MRKHLYQRSSHPLKDGLWMQNSARDRTQRDEQFLLRAGFGDLIQQTMKNPDGNGVPFFTNSIETAAGNLLV